MRAKYISIGKRRIGPGYPVFVVAEVSSNHQQSYKRALQIIDAAIDAGVDAIKLQTCSPDTLTIDCNNKYFNITKGPWKGNNLYQFYKIAYTPWEWQARLKKYVEDRGILLFSTPVDETAVDFLEKLKVKVYKVASFEAIDTGLLERIGKTKKPVIISRGMASEEEIMLALRTLRKYGTPQVAILHCVSDYPAVPKDMNLRTIPDLTKKFSVVSGLSDHTLGISTSIAAVALGASIIEKHVTLRRSDGGPDAFFSLEPEELKELVKSVREVEMSLGKPTYSVVRSEEKNIIFRRSLFVVKDVEKGEKLSKENIRSIRPGHGLAPVYFKSVLKKTAIKNIKKGTPLSWKLIN